MKRGTPAATILTLAAFLLAPDVGRAQNEDPLADLIAHIDASSRELPGFEVIEAVPDPNPGAPASRLRALLRDLVALEPGREGQGMLPLPVREHVDAAAQALRGAIALRNASVPGDGQGQRFDELFGALVKAVAALDRAGELPQGLPLRAKLAALAARTAAAARRIATAVIDAAASSEENTAAVAEARAQLALGDLELGRDEPLLAVALYQFGTSFAADVITFHLETFERNIRDALAGITVGWAYSVGLNGVLFNQDADGVARTEFDTPEGDPALAQSPDKEMFIASISKTISAAALLKALNQAGIAVQQPIEPHLPADWTRRGPNVGQITFRHLLTHRSGLFDEDAGDLAALEDAIARGSSGAADDNESNYSNVNYNLLRVLIPQLVYDPGAIANYANVFPLDAVYAGLYIDYVRFQVLAPAQVHKLDCAPAESPQQQTLLYSLNDPPQAAGVRTDDWNLVCGAAGWYLSANELASLLAHLRFTDAILDDGTRELMDELFLGWHDPQEYANWVEGAFGTYRAHSGDIYFIENQPGSAGMYACVMNFQINVQASLVINSRGGGLGRPCTILKDAYDAAWF